MSTTAVPATNLSFWSAIGVFLRDSWRRLRLGGPLLWLVILSSQLIIFLAVFPIQRWLLQEALRSSGMVALDFDSLHLTTGVPLTLTILVLLGFLAFFLLTLQFGAILGVLGRSRDAVAGVPGKIWKPSSWPIFLYVFLLLPLSGLGFMSPLLKGISVPPFILGEVEKMHWGPLALAVGGIVLAVINLRLALTLPLYILTPRSGTSAMADSWRLTRRPLFIALLLAGVAGTIITLVAAGLLFGLTLLPTYLCDLWAPGASTVVAGISLGFAHIAFFFLAGLFTAFLGALLISYLQRLDVAGLNAAPLPEHFRLAPRGISWRRRFTAAFVALFVVAGAVNSVSSVATMAAFDTHPTTLVLGHRGFTQGGVENTIAGLEAASEAGADLVEMDVMETKDGEFIVMHDTSLRRLANLNLQVRDLTLEELTAIEVEDGHGLSGPIPSLEEYVLRAQELDMTLLIEIKLGGADSEDHVEKLVQQLSDLGVLETNIYHTLDHKSVETLKTLRPDLTVGYILPIAVGGVPETSADFIVVEEWSANSSIQQQAEDEGLGFFAWTINTDTGQRQYLRRGVDGIITDRPDWALDSREEMAAEVGTTQKLLDALRSFVTVF